MSAPRLTNRVLDAMASALAAAENCAEPENEHPGVDMDDMARAMAWVHHQQRKRASHTEKKGGPA